MSIETIKNSKYLPKSKKDIPKFIINAGLNIAGEKLNKQLSSVMGSGITLRNNEIKDTTKVIKSQDNRVNI